MIEPVVSSQWLNDNLNSSGLIILDASSLNNKAGLTLKFENHKIKGAQFFDLKNTFSDPNGLFPNTLPSEEQFETGCRSLGINKSSRIVVYDNLGIYTSPRVYWMFKTMGHEKIHVLNGGLPSWINDGYETVEHFDSKIKQGDFEAKLQSELVKSITFVKSNISEQNHLLIDARSEVRFNGTVKEPREGLRSGHIRNSINIPFSRFLENGRYKNADKLREIFEDTGVDDRPIIFSCGSGVTACIVLLACEMVLNNSTSVYDGSWTEWASLTKDGI
ncbi:MAG: rhodanese-like domain-containing protein [Polaribacter sp.]|nr:rhodanese-like domain-containing protein [Polaribacter sp.]